MDTFAARGNISVKVASFLDTGISYSYMTDTDVKSTVHAEHVFHARVHHAFVPVKVCKLKLENLIFAPDALRNLKDIEKLYLEKKNFNKLHSLFVKFFKNYGSHVNVGSLCFGGIYNWTATYESEHMSKEKFSVDIVNHVLEAYVTGSKYIVNYNVGGTISGDVIKKKTDVSGNYDESELSKVLCGVSIYGGPPESGTYHDWKTGLTSENSTWNLIERNEFIGIWEILSNHCMDFKHYSKLSQMMEMSFHIEFQFDKSIREIEQSKYQSILLIFQHHIKIVCQEFTDTDYVSGLMTLQYIQDLFSHIIFITQNSTDERFVFEIKASMEKIVIYMNNLDNPVKNSIVSWIGDPNSIKENTSGILAAENIQDVESLYSAMKTKFLPFVKKQHRKRDENELNEYIKEELTVVILRLLSSLKEKNKFHYAFLLSQLQIFTYNVKTYSFPDSLGLDDLVAFTNDLESSMVNYRTNHSLGANDQAFVINVIISNMHKYNVSNKEVVFDECLHPIKPTLNQKIVQILNVCTNNSPYNWSLLEHRIELLIKGDDYTMYYFPLPEIPCNEQINQTGFDSKLYQLTQRATCVLGKLGLLKLFPKQLDFVDAISLSLQTFDEHDFRSLPMMVLKDIIMVNMEARDQNLLNYLQNLKITCKSKDRVNEEEEEEDEINPLDMLVALFYCSSYTLQQVIAIKLFSCCIAIPFVFPPNANNDLLLLLGTLRGLIVNMKSEYGLCAKTAADIPCHVLSFIRLGRPQFSKSSMINKFLSSVDCNTFHNKDRPLGLTPHELSNGLIEFSLFPTPHRHFMFALNLRGDGFEFENSVRVLSSLSSVVVVCIEANHLTDAQSLERLKVINNYSKGMLLALDGNMLDREQMNQLREKYKNALPSENFQKTLIITIRLNKKEKDLSKIKVLFHQLVSELLQNQQDTNMKKRIRYLRFKALFVDENCFDLSEKENASLVMSKLPHCEDIRQLILPLQTNILSEISAYFKKKHNSSDTIALKQDKNIQDILKLREKQLQTMRTLHPFLQAFIAFLLKYKDSFDQLNIFIVLMKAYLDDRCRKSNSLQKEKSKDVLYDRSLLSRYTDSSFGLEHVMREVSQIFESCFALKSQCDQMTWSRVSKFPVIAAQILLKGQSIEVMDGDTGYVPLDWIKAIFEALGNALPGKKCLVLSIIGIQSTGKSTLLNTMFGLTFPVGAGRCTKGVFMQIVPVSGKDFQYILVLDTEGLRAPTRGNDMTKFDNEIATFVIGLAHINIVNIKGESASQVKEVISMAVCSLLRLKLGNPKINHHQTCLFVHQNAATETVYQRTEQERNILKSELDAMTAAAAEQINNTEIHKISDVINFDPNENVFYIPDLGADQMKYISIGYSLSVAKLKEKIMADASNHRPYLVFSNLTLRVQDLWTGILGDSYLFNFSDSLSLKAYNEMNVKFLELKWKFHRQGEDQLHEMKHLLSATNIDFKEFAENLKNEVENVMQNEMSVNIKTFNEFINTNHLVHEMEHWRKIMTEKLKTVQEKIILTLLEDFAKLIGRVELKTKQSRRVIELGEKLILKIRKLNKEEQQNKNLLDQMFNEHWALSNPNLISGMHTSLPSMKELMHRLVNEHASHSIKSYLKEYMSEPANTKMEKQSILVDSFTCEDIDISVLNVKQRHNPFIGMIKCKKTDCIQDALSLINLIFTKIDSYLKTTSYSVSQFENRFALTSFSFIDDNITSFHSKNCTLSPKFHALLLSHVAKFLIIYFTSMHTKEEEKQRKFRKQEEELMQQYMSNITESDNAANYFMKVLAAGMEEHVLTKISGKVADFIVDEFGHSKHKLIKAILLDLANMNRFHYLKMYIDEPRDYAIFWVLHYTNRKIFAITKETTLTLYGKIAKDLLLEVTRPLKNGIIHASRSCGKSWQNNSSWINVFTKEIKKSKVFPLKQELLTFIQRHVTDFETFSTALLEKFDEIENTTFNLFAQTTEKNVKWKECPYNKICDELWGCDAKCPFCGETCIDSTINHLEFGEKHRCWMHRPQGIGDMKVTKKQFIFLRKEVLQVENCNFLIGSSKMYQIPGCKESRKFKDFRKDYENWEIRDDKSTRPEYWMWIFCEYGHELEIVNCGVKLPKIPANRKVKKEVAIKSLENNGSS